MCENTAGSRRAGTVADNGPATTFGKGKQFSMEQTPPSLSTADAKRGLQIPKKCTGSLFAATPAKEKAPSPSEIQTAPQIQERPAKPSTRQTSKQSLKKRAQTLKQQEEALDTQKGENTAEELTSEGTDSEDERA
ncbi:hypothetical protein IWW48_000092 [Coemansia sp. RSA 1200]|nr:hypothetical protein IWW48_000092 [Coemansia sp. RSA 1200]